MIVMNHKQENALSTKKSIGEKIENSNVLS